MDQSSGGEQFVYRPEKESISSAPVELPQATVSANPEDLIVRWEASEFIDHQKSSAWSTPLALGVLVFAGLTYLVTRSIFSSIVLLLGGVAFMVLAHQKPRTLTYVLNGNGIRIGDKYYQFDDFRTFSIMQDGALYSIFLEPIKRFMPPLSIYFAPEDGERIFDILAAHIPHQERQADPIERFMRRIRF